MEACSRSRGMAPLILNLVIRLRLVNCTPWPLYSLQKIPIAIESVVPRADLDVWRRDNNVAPTECEPRTFKPVA
jgi:hypothetical protein